MSRMRTLKQKSEGTKKWKFIRRERRKDIRKRKKFLSR